jgi:hypothetical protein
MTVDISAISRRVPHASLGDLAALLRDQQARKLDIVAPAAAIRVQDGALVVDDSVPVLGEDGVTMSAGASGLSKSRPPPRQGRPGYALCMTTSLVH